MIQSGAYNITVAHEHVFVTERKYRVWRWVVTCEICGWGPSVAHRHGMKPPDWGEAAALQGVWVFKNKQDAFVFANAKAKEVITATAVAIAMQAFKLN